MTTKQLDRIYVVNELRRYAHPSVYHSLLSLSTPALYGVLSFYENGGTNKEIRAFKNHVDSLSRGLEATLLRLEVSAEAMNEANRFIQQDVMTAMDRLVRRKKVHVGIIAIVAVITMFIATLGLMETTGLIDIIRGMFITHLY